MSRRHDSELWQRTIIESLRPIDPQALFWVPLLEIEDGDASDDELDAFPDDELVAFVDAWLDELDPDGEPAERTWEREGVCMRFKAQGRGATSRGWTAMPSFNLLEQRMADIELADGTRRQFISLTRAEVEGLASGELALPERHQVKKEWFAMVADEMRDSGHKTVGDMHPTVITAHAGTLGLVAPPP